MKKYFAAAAAACIGAAALISPAEASQPHQSTHYYSYPPRRSSTYRYNNRRYYNTAPTYYTSATGAIAAAAARWGVAYSWLLRVATCESGLNPGAYNPYSGASGLFQFMPGTYYMYAARIGETGSIWNAASSANVAAYMFSIGLSYQWACR